MGENPGNWVVKEFEQFELMFERELEMLNEKKLDEKLAFEERVLTMKNYRAGSNALRRDRSSLKSDYEYDQDYVKNLVEFEYDYLLEENRNEQSDLAEDMKNDVLEEMRLEKAKYVHKLKKVPGSYTMNK